MSSNRKTSRNRSKASGGPPKSRAGTVVMDDGSQLPQTPNKADIKSMTIDLASVNKSQSIVEDEEEILPNNNSGRATSHRDVPQKRDTVFRIRAEDWNNVPKVTYEAITALVIAFDEFRLQNSKQNQTNSRELRDIKNLISSTENKLKNDNNRLDATIN